MWKTKVWSEKHFSNIGHTGQEIIRCLKEKLLCADLKESSTVLLGTHKIPAA